MTKIAYLTGLAAFALATMTMRSPEDGSGAAPTAEFGENGLGAFKTPFSDSQKAAAASAQSLGGPLHGLSGKSIAVHKKDAEGVLMIDALSGVVILDGAPEWATDLGLSMAMHSERVLWYTKRIGSLPDELAKPEVLAFEDLTWFALNPTDGEETVIEADDEFRMEVLAQALDINRSIEDGVDTIAGKGYEIHVASDNTRSEAELASLREAQEERFEKTGTGE